MILIIVTWIVFAFFFIPSGLFVKRLLNIENTNFSITIFIGMGLQCVALTVASFFFRIGVEVFVVNLTLMLILWFFSRKQITEHLICSSRELKNLFPLSKLLLLSMVIVTAYTSAKLPFLIDNESYYVQTIKWINQYGLVKGLANLHVFFGQTSPLHILQAGFNFNFITDRFNDINGFILMVGSNFFITEFDRKKAESEKNSWIGFLLIFAILFLQFVSEPSPDLAIYVLSPIALFLFLEQKNNTAFFRIATLLVLFIFFIKITTTPFILLLIYWGFREKKRLSFLFILLTFISLILIAKNTIVTGYPFYPFDFFPTNFDWILPHEMLTFIFDATSNAGYLEGRSFEDTTFIEKLVSWLNLTGLNRIFNWGILLLFLLVPFTKKFRKLINYRIVYFILLIHFMLLLVTSPQFRFFLPEFIFFSVIIASEMVDFLKLAQKTTALLLLFMIFIPLLIFEFVSFESLTANPFHQKKSKFSWRQIVVPEKTTKYAAIPFEKVKNGNLEYYSPQENFFFYGTSNGTLPCVNKIQIDYFEKTMGITPQLRGATLKEGFYSLNTTVK